LVTIPNELLLPDTYTISVELTNFALKSSIGFITVQMMNSADTPKFSITGPQILSQLRWQPTTIFASAKVAGLNFPLPPSLLSLIKSTI
jgi:hypothetical protein